MSKHWSKPILFAVALYGLVASGCAIYFEVEDGDEAGEGTPGSEPPREPPADCDGCGSGGGSGPGGPSGPGAPGGPGGPGGPGDSCAGLATEPVILDCNVDNGDEVNSWRAESVSGTRLHLVSVYETRSDHTGSYHPTGTATVEFALPGQNVLALASYEPTEWTVTLAPGASLEKIVAIGYFRQTVIAPPGIEVETHYYAEEQYSPYAACGYSLPYNGQGCDTDQLIANVEALTGLALSSFDGCYAATAFRLATSSVCEPQGNDDGNDDGNDGGNDGRGGYVAPAIRTCETGSTWLYRTENAPETALHIAGLYETHSDHGYGNHPMGDADVHFALPGDNVLALSSYEPVHWHIDVAPGAGLTKVIAFGHHEQIVSAPPGVEVEIHTYEPAGDPLWAIGFDLSPGSSNDLITKAELVTGLTMTSFDGCYRATELIYEPL